MSEENIRAAGRRIIVALDVPNAASAVSAAEELRDSVGLFKIGMELYYSADGGHRVVEKIQELAPDVGIMLDLKIADTTDTMMKTVGSVKSLKPRFLTAHAAFGSRHLAACVDAAGPDIGILGVTVPTTLDANDYIQIAGIPSGPGDLEMAQNALEHDVRVRALMAEMAHCAGIVSSACDLHLVRRVSEELFRVTPGIRPEWAPANDQRRVMTPFQAISAGASYLVIGRPILKPPPEIGSPREAARRVAEEIASYFP